MEILEDHQPALSADELADEVDPGTHSLLGGPIGVVHHADQFGMVRHVGVTQRVA
jgi:hypothetical protein